MRNIAKNNLYKMKKATKISAVVISIAISCFSITHAADGPLTGNYFFNQQENKINIIKNKKSIKSRADLRTPYRTGIGLCAGLTYGLSVKHFIMEENAIEVIVGSRWGGISLTGLYKFCIDNSTKKMSLLIDFGGGPRFGFYNGKNYSDYNGLNRDDSGYPIVGFVGDFGIEYFFKKLPFTIAFEYRPFFDLAGKGDTEVDGVVSLHYVFSNK